LLIETTDDGLQAGFHLCGDVAGMLDLLQYCGWKQLNGRCLLTRLTGRRCDQQQPGDQSADRFQRVFPVMNP